MVRFARKRFPSHARLLEVCAYDPLTGIFTRKWSVHKPNIGKRMGCENRYGYNRITVDRVVYPAAALAWFYMTGKWPENEVDHKNRIRNDDRWENLREATPSQNAVNKEQRARKNKCGYRGIKNSWNGKFQAGINVNGKAIKLGEFDTIEKAALAYDLAAKKYYGEFAVFNFPNSVHRDWILL